MEDLKNNGYYKITITEPHKGETVEYTIWWEASIDDWLDLFKKILYWISFRIELIKTAFREEEDEV